MRKRLALVAAAAFALTGCASPESDAIRAAEAMGFRDARVTSKHYIAPDVFGCSESDSWGVEVSAKNPTGARVALIVCGGWVFKSPTVRVK